MKGAIEPLSSDPLSDTRDMPTPTFLPSDWSSEARAKSLRVKDRRPCVRAVVCMSALLTCCSRPEPVVATRVDPHALVVSLKRFPCEGTCPYYEVMAFEDGVVDFDGLMFVREGHFGGRVSPADLASLKETFVKADFLSLKSAYEDKGTTDCARVVLTAQVNGTLKTVRHYLCDGSAPKALTVLEDEIDRLLATHKWIGSRQ